VAPRLRVLPGSTRRAALAAVALAAVALAAVALAAVALAAVAVGTVAAAEAAGAARAGSGSHAHPASSSTIAIEPFVSKLAAYGGVVAWSHWDPAVGGYRLMAHSRGLSETLPVAPRTVPFDVDLGPDARNRPVAVYSRCAHEQAVWTLGAALTRMRLPAGCVLYRYDFAARREQLIRGVVGAGSFYLPTIWQDEIAYVRLAASRAPQLVAQPLHAARHKRIRAVTLPGGASIGAGGAGPVSLDLSAGKLAFAWHTGGTELGSDIAVDTLPVPASGRGASQVASQTTYDAEAADPRAPGFVDFPALSGDRVFYGRFDGSAITPADDAFEQVPSGASSLRPAAAPAPHALRGQAQDGGTTYALYGPYSGSFSDCGPSGCALVLIRGLQFQPA
jgi:hypothetical protein